jgi:hypothetical protein
MLEHETLQTIVLLQINPRGKKTFALKSCNITALPSPPKIMYTSKVARCIETLCHKGCKEVTQIILALERGDPLEEVRDLSEEERQAVLDELKAIMAVYGEGGSCDTI